MGTSQLEFEDMPPIVCPGCGQEDPNLVTEDECSDYWVNEDCPAGCNAEHRGPDVRWDGGTWECPETGEEYYYTGPSTRNTGDWEPVGRYEEEYSVLVGDWYYYYEEVTSCDACGEAMLCDDAHYDDDDGCVYCEEHARGGAQSVRGMVATMARCQTSGCRNPLTHFNPFTESAHCAEHAGERDELLESIAA